MDKPLVSIIIPVYNAERYLAQCIDSAINQTWANKEIIIVDDGSTDSSLTIAQQYECDWIKVLYQENKGASAARNTGLEMARGTYIQFLDADDMLSVNKIENQVYHLLRSPQSIAICDTIYFYNAEDLAGALVQPVWYQLNEIIEPVDFILKLYGGEIIADYYGGMVQPNAWLTPREIIDVAGLWNEELSLDDDGEYFCRIILASNGIIYCPNAFNYYRKFKSGNNLSAGKTIKAAKSLLHSAELKVQHVLAATDLPLAKMALSRILHDIAFMFFPMHSGLSLTAKKQAVALCPDFEYQPYKKGVKSYLSKILGWKFVKYLDHLRYGLNPSKP